MGEYISAVPKAQQKKLREMRACLKKAVPKAEESLKWSVPAFMDGRILFMYAAFKKHIGFYPTPSAMREFKKDLKEYKTAKGSIQFPYDKPLPKALITKNTKFRAKELKGRDVKWM